MKNFCQAYKGLMHDLFGAADKSPRVIGIPPGRPEWTKKLANGWTLNLTALSVSGSTIGDLRAVPMDCRQEAVDFVCARMNEYVRAEVFGR